MNRRVALLDCEDSEHWAGCIEKLWRAALEEPGDAWTLYQACKGELPTAEEARAFDAIIVGGSHYSAYEQLDWLNQLLAALKQYAALDGPRIYGCCFGCQALAVALGGCVGPNPDNSFTLTIERVTLDPQAAQFPQMHAVLQQALADANGGSAGGSAGDGSSTSADTVVERLAGCSTGSDGSSSCGKAAQGPLAAGSNAGADAPPSSATTGAADASEEDASQQSVGQCCFRLMESHGDQVLQLPPGAATLATSRTARHELWAWGSRVLASQFHLELPDPLVLDKIWPRLTDANRLSPEQSAASRTVLEAGGQHNAQLLGVVRHFLAHGVC